MAEWLEPNERFCFQCGRPGRQVSSGQGDSTPGGEWHHYPDPWAGVKKLSETDVHSFVIEARTQRNKDGA